MKIAAYCRVSTDRADQLNSLETQKKFFVEYAEKNGHDLIRLYADEGLSGTKIRHRRQFQQMMADAELGLFDQLVVKDISRLARNTVDLLQSVRHLKALGIQTLFLTANMDSMGDSEFVLTMFGALAQEESANMSKRIKFGKRVNAERGRVPNLVYGYDKTIGDYFNLTINPEEAAIIRQMYDWYINDGYGANKIAATLNQQGRKTKQGRNWSQNAVCRILTNPLYTGKIINGKQEISDFLTSARVKKSADEWKIVDRPELRIITDEQFRRAGEIKAERNRKFRHDHKRQNSKYLFSTLIQCKECGWSFRRVSRTYQNTYVRWTCSKRNGQGADQCENAVSLEENALMDKLDEYFRSLIQDRKKVIQMIRQELKKTYFGANTSEEDRKKLQSRLSKLERTRQKYLDLYADDLITRQELDKRLGSTREEIGHLEEQLRQMELTMLDDKTIDRMISQIFQNLDEFLTVRKLNNGQLKQLISKIEVDKDGNVDVYLRLFPGELWRDTVSPPQSHFRGRIQWTQ
ncbi:MAG: recombinase family protein [Oscillospiraceae bacterium]|nr:recombinase family protein [Oscillospiraceae bacterium]